MEQTVKQRITAFLDKKDIKTATFERLSGLSNGYLKQLRKEPSREKIEGILKAYPELNEDWLKKGEGNMLKEDKPDTDVVAKKRIISYYPDVDGSMGDVYFLEDPDETVEEIVIPGYSDCKYAINAYGDSMYPTIQSGQIVLLAPWTENFVTWGHIYLIITKSGYRAIKRLFQGSDDSRIECRSDNGESNPPFEILKDDISRTYIVKGWICRNEI